MPVSIGSVGRGIGGSAREETSPPDDGLGPGTRRGPRRLQTKGSQASFQSFGRLYHAYDAGRREEGRGKMKRKREKKKDKEKWKREKKGKERKMEKVEKWK